MQNCAICKTKKGYVKHGTYGGALYDIFSDLYREELKYCKTIHDGAFDYRSKIVNYFSNKAYCRECGKVIRDADMQLELLEYCQYQINQCIKNMREKNGNNKIRSKSKERCL